MLYRQEQGAPVRTESGSGKLRARRGRSHLYGHAGMRARHGDMEQAVVFERNVRRSIQFVGCDIGTQPEVSPRVEDQVIRAGKAIFRAARQEGVCNKLLCSRVVILFRQPEDGAVRAQRVFGQGDKHRAGVRVDLNVLGAVLGRGAGQFCRLAGADQQFRLCLERLPQTFVLIQ